MKRSQKILATFGLGLLIGTMTPGCVVRVRGTARAGVVYEQPPAPQVETYGTRVGHVWVRGRWNWNGNRWVWMPGHWERERAGYVWQDGRWEQRGNQWVWVEGQWGQQPGGVVVSNGTNTVVVNNPSNNPGGVAVRDHRDNVVVAPSPYPTAAPPALQVENPGSRSGHIWISGRWAWQNGNWAWTPGHWERAKANQVWVAGRWEMQGNYWVWVEGSWQAAPSSGPAVRDHR